MFCLLALFAFPRWRIYKQPSLAGPNPQDKEPKVFTPSGFI
jgi:hypothetical protein